MTAKQKNAILLALVLFLGISVSCQQIPVSTLDNTSKTDVDSTRSLNFRITWKSYSGRGVAIQKIVDAYNQTPGDHFTINMIGGDEELTTIENSIISETNTIYVLPYRYVKYLGAKDLLKELSADFSFDQTLFYPSIWNLGKIENSKLYSIPWLGHSMCLIYNKSLLSQAGVDASSITSLAKLQQAIELVEAKTSARGFGLVGADHNDVSWMVNQFIYGFGSSLVSEDGTKVVINNEKARAALDFYKNVLGQHAQPNWEDATGAEVMTAFRKQEVAFEIQGIWGVTDIQQNGSPFEVGLIALDSIGLRAEVGPMMLSMPLDMSDTNTDEAGKFIHYLISKSAQEQIMNGEYSIEHDAYYPFRTPIRIDMADSQIFRSYPEFLIFIEGFKNPSVDVPVPAWQIIKDQLYQSELHKVMTDEMTIEDFLQLIETEGNIILKG